MGGCCFLSFSRSLQVSSIAPSATRSPRRPDDQAPPRGDACQEQPGIEGRPEQIKRFFSGAVFVSFFVYSNVLHLLCFFLFWNKLFAASPKVMNDMGAPREGPRLARDGENKACGIHSPMPPHRSLWPNSLKPSMRLSLPCSLTLA